LFTGDNNSTHLRQLSNLVKQHFCSTYTWCRKL